MENSFKKIGYPPKQPPKKLKKKILEDLSAIKLLIDMTDLFSNKYMDTVESFLKIKE